MVWKIGIGLGLTGLVLANLFYIYHLRTQNNKLKTELQKTAYTLENCQATNEMLTKELAVQKEEYQKKVSQLLKQAQKPVRVIEIPKVIEKEVKIESEECQKMAIMIDEFLKIERGEHK